MKKYRYDFVEINKTYYADNGDECESQYNAEHSEPYEGIIIVTNTETGDSHEMLPIKFM